MNIDKSKPYIFISYARKDLGRVLPTVKYLQKQCFQVWYDKEQMEASVNWAEYIGEHLQDSACVIAFISANSLLSKNCADEIFMADKECKDILPVYLDEVALTPGLKLKIGMLHALERWKCSDDQEFWEKLIKEPVLESCQNVEDEDFQEEDEPEEKERCLLEELQVEKIQNEDTVNVKKAKIGEYVFFGHYKQYTDSYDGKEKIRWRVLNKRGDELLLISERCLEIKPYHDEQKYVTWEISTLRSWLNNEFYENSFTKKEKSQIIYKILKNSDNQSWDTMGGIDTNDRVFLLSIDEVEKYFSSEADREAAVTEHVKSKGCWTSGVLENSWWWLRTPGYHNGNAVYVGTKGTINDYGYSVQSKDVTVRPAIWIRLKI